ncbi:MAG: FKBP-type peptidyl-prolyl cis-trans isomerase [Oceanococcus sp.]
MSIGPNKVVSFHYRLSEVDGDELESSRKGDAVLYLHGHGNLLPALEDAMIGKAAGDVFNVTLAPEQAYGLPREGSQQRVPIKHLIASGKLRKGMAVKINTEQGQRDVRIVKLGRFTADVDTNHPFAGMSLNFEIEIIDMRDATADEITHKHAHGPGGHQH